MATPTPLTELEAVNVILKKGLGMSPVNSITGTITADVAAAVAALNAVSLEVQQRGWEFNTEEDYPLNPNGDGEILLSGLLRVDVPQTSFSSVDATQRGNKLYDKKNRTYVFTDSLKADVIVALDFTELPPAARSYITIRAAREFQRDYLGSKEIDAFTEVEEFQALATLQDAETENADHNIFNAYDIGRITQRRHQ